MKRGSPQASADLDDSKIRSSKVIKTNKMYQKAGLATAGVRVITRSKARAEAALESRSRCPEAVPEARASLHVLSSTESVPGLTETQLSAAQPSLLPPLAATVKHRSVNHAPSLTANSTSKLPVAASNRATAIAAFQQGKSAVEPLHHQPSDDLHQLDVTPAINSKLIHPSLLQHPGVGGAKKQQLSRSVQPAAVAAAAQRLHRSPSPSRARHAASQQSASPAAAADGSSDSGPSRRHQRPTRRVSFAPGPLSPQKSSNCTVDGHPASEGAQAVPVRRGIAPSYALDLTKGNVLFLENLLGEDCQMSVMRLKRRVGLLPPIRPPRPHVGTRPGHDEATPPPAAPAAAAPKSTPGH